MKSSVKETFVTPILLRGKRRGGGGGGGGGDEGQGREGGRKHNVIIRMYLKMICHRH